MTQGPERTRIPDTTRFTESSPKTRSGTIMRRSLRDIVVGREQVGDTTTLEVYSVLACPCGEEEARLPRR